MIGFKNEMEKNENIQQKCSEKWNKICKVSNAILSVVYLLFGWIFGFFGIMFFSLGLPDKGLVLICSFVSSLLFLMIPLFCVFGIVFSIHLRKKEQFTAAFLVQFLPFYALGIALISFLLSVIIV